VSLAVFSSLPGHCPLTLPLLCGGGWLQTGGGVRGPGSSGTRRSWGWESAKTEIAKRRTPAGSSTLSTSSREFSNRFPLRGLLEHVWGGAAVSCRFHGTAPLTGGPYLPGLPCPPRSHSRAQLGAPGASLCPPRSFRSVRTPGASFPPRSFRSVRSARGFLVPSKIIQVSEERQGLPCALQDHSGQ